MARILFETDVAAPSDAIVAALTTRDGIAAWWTDDVDYAGEATGLLLHLPGWQYPVVIDVLTGTLRYDNFGGRWGDHAQLDRFLQCYAVERCRIEARKKGHAVTEQQLADGSVRLTIAEGG